MNQLLPIFDRSDGPQPHSIHVQFTRLQWITDILLYMDYKLDESYTPSKISVRAGTSPHDLQEVYALDMDEPQGWLHIPLGTLLVHGNDGSDASSQGWDPPVIKENTEEVSMGIQCRWIQVCILANHQNGKDTHVRQIKVYTDPRLAFIQDAGPLSHYGYPSLVVDDLQCASTEFQWFTVIR